MRGFSLVQVLLLGALALVTAFSLAAITTSHLNLATRSCNRVEALCLAEGAIHEAIGRIHARPDFGQSRESVWLGQNTDRWAVVSFDPANGFVSPSQNSLQADGSSGTAHLVARGQVRGVRRDLEVLLAVPPYLYTVATAGALTSKDGLEVRELSTGSGGAHVASNTAITATGRFVASGDVISPSISLPRDAIVEGRRISDAGPVELPTINLDDWDPRAIPELSNWTTRLGSRLDDGLIQGPSYTALSDDGGDLVVNGNLRLDKGLLFVQGDLTVRGKVYGEGALIVKGKTSIQGAVDVSAVNERGSQVALLAGGQVTLDGQGEPNRFQGLIYTDAGFAGRNVQMVGALAQSPRSGSGDVSLNQVILDADPDATRMLVRVESGGPLIALHHGEPWRTALASELATQPSVGQALTLAARPEMDQAIRQAYAGKPFFPQEFIPEQNTGVSPEACFIPLPSWQTRVLPRVGSGTASRLRSAYAGATDLQLVAAVVRKEYANPPGQGWQQGKSNIEPLWGRYAVGKSDYRVFYYLAGAPRGGLPQGPVLYLTQTEAHKLVKEYTGGNGNRDEQIIRTALAAQQAMVDVANRRMDEAGAPRGEQKWQRTLDLNRFLQDTLPLRILRWREL